MTLPAKILVTGGAGFIGSHCCKALAQAGSTPIVYDNLSRGHAEAVRWGPLVVGDLRDRDLLLRTVRDKKIDAVVHFAALAYVGESVVQPQMYYDNNVGGMVTLLDVLQQTNIGQIVFSSSCATYGVPTDGYIAEHTPQSPINPYGRTKLICEWMLEDAAQASGLRFAALRYFNAAGADPDGELAERHDPETHLVPLALMAALGTGPELRIFGTDYPTEDGTCVRDYIHVDDLARAHVLALQALSEGSNSLTLNLGTGQGTSVRQVIEAVNRVCGRKVPLIEAPRRPGDPPELVADPAKAEEILGFRTRWNDMDEIVGHAAACFSTKPGGATTA